MIKVTLAVTNDIVTDNRLHKIANTLFNNGFVVTVVGRKFTSSANLFNRPYKTRRFRLWFNKTMFFYANYNLRLFLYLLKVPVDIIVANDLDTLLACWLAAKIRRKVLLFDSHELFTELPELIDRPFIKKIWHLNERFLLRGIDKGYTVSSPIQEYFKTKYKHNFELIRNTGVFRNEYFMKPIPKEKIVIYQGAVNIGRGLELMMETLKLMDNTKLWIIGDGDILDDLKLLAINLGVENKVIFFGKIALDSLVSYTSKAHIGISLEEDLGLNYRYSLPNKIFDYIQCRVPVIVSDLPEMRSLIEKHRIGIVIKDRKPQKLAEIIENLSNDEEKQETLSYNLELASRELCWQREEEKIVNLYRNAAELVNYRTV